MSRDEDSTRRLTSLGRDWLPAYSCETRYFDPGCHQKRKLACTESLKDNLLAPVPRRYWNYSRYEFCVVGRLCAPQREWSGLQSRVRTN